MDFVASPHAAHPGLVVALNGKKDRRVGKCECYRTAFSSPNVRVQVHLTIPPSRQRGLVLRQGRVDLGIVRVEVGALDLIDGFPLIQLIIGCLIARYNRNSSLFELGYRLPPSRGKLSAVRLTDEGGERRRRTS